MDIITSYIIAASIPIFLLTIGWLLLIPPFMRQLWYKRMDVVVAQYEPPYRLRPAECQMFDTGSFRYSAVRATIIDLIARGVILMKDGAAGRELIKGDDRDVELFEQFLLRVIFEKSDTVAAADLSTLAFRRNIETGFDSMRVDIAHSLLDEGLQIPLGAPLRRQMIVMTLYSLGLIAIGAVLILVLPPAGWISWFLAVVAAVVQLTAGFSEVREGSFNGKAWRQFEGFKLFLRVADRDLPQGSKAPKRTQKLYAHLLPYAIAFGLEHEWQAQFAGFNQEYGLADVIG